MLHYNPAECFVSAFAQACLEGEERAKMGVNCDCRSSVSCCLSMLELDLFWDLSFPHQMGFFSPSLFRGKLTVREPFLEGEIMEHRYLLDGRVFKGACCLT